MMNDFPQQRRSMPGRFRARVMLIGLIVPCILFGAAWYFISSSGERDRLIAKGIHVPGRLIGVEETGTRINRVPQLLLTMEFTRRDGRLDTAQTKFTPQLRRISYFQPGIDITVAYDSTDPHKATLVDLKTGSDAALGGTVDSLRYVADSLKKELEKRK